MFGLILPKKKKNRQENEDVFFIFMYFSGKNCPPPTGWEKPGSVTGVFTSKVVRSTSQCLILQEFCLSVADP